MAAVVGLTALVLLMLWPTTRAMAEIWQSSETYKHGYLVLPLFGWLVWRQRAALAQTPVRPWWPAMLAAAGALAVWLLGELASANAPSQLAMIALVPAGVAALFGLRWLRLLAFPLAFLFFAVPLGDALVPWLTNATADFVVAALQLTGVPVLREGNNLVVPSGTWSVVEACSGIRFLIASIFAGVLYAYFLYRSPWRRIAFLFVSVAVPVVANWLRAYGIVMLGHLTDNRIAVGVDHLVYGWVFFGFVILVMFGIGATWREDEPRPLRAARRPPPAATVPVLRTSLPAVAAFVMILAALSGVRAHLLAPVEAPPLQPAAITPTAGWAAVAPVSDWQPDIQPPAAFTTQTFARGDVRVGVYIGYFRDHTAESKLASSLNQLVRSDNRRWFQLAWGEAPVDIGGARVTVRTGRLRSPEQELVVWQWYWLGETVTVRDWRAKLDLAFDRLLRRDDTAAWVAIYTSGTDRDAARILQQFLSDMAPQLDAAMNTTARR